MRTTLSVVVLVLLALTAPHLRAAPPNPDAPSVAGKLVGPEKLDEKLCKTFRVRAYQKDESKSRRGREGFTALECKSSLTTSGGFEIRELPECQCQLWAELDGWISEPLDLLVPANGKVFNMRAAGKIKVGLDFKGMPPAVQDASLRVAVKESKNFELDPTNTKVWQLAADAVLIDVNIPSGNCELFLHWGSDPDSFSPEALRFTPEPATFKLGSGETREVRLSCEPCARLTLIEEGGRSVSPSHVVLTNDGKKPPFRGSSQQGGTLSLYQLLAGKYTMKINMPHYEPYAAEVVLKAGEICTHEYKLKPTADNKLTGTVVDDKGKPVAGAELRVGATGATSVSDKDGRFTVNEPYAGGSFDTIYVMADGFEEEWYKPQGADVQIKLRRATMIHGSIKGGAGMRVQVAVYKTYPGDSDDYDNKLEFGLSKPDGSYALTLLSSFRGAIPQSADVVLTHGTTVIVKHIEGLAKGMWVGVDFELPAGGSLSGTVKGIEGKPVAGLNMRLYCYKSDGQTTTLTGSDGKYQFMALAPGDYHLSISQDNPAWVSDVDVSLKAKEAQVRDLDFTGKCRVRFNVTLKGKPIDSVEVSLYRHSGSFARARREEKSTQTLEIIGLAPGTYVAEYFNWDSREVTETLVIPSGKQELVIEKDIGAMTLSGTVKLPPNVDATKRDGWQVLMFVSPDYSYASAPIAADGSYSFKDLKPGKYRAVAMIPGWASKPVDLEIFGAVKQDFALLEAGKFVLNTTFTDTSSNTENVSVTLTPSGSTFTKDEFFFRDVTLKKGVRTVVCASVLPGRYAVKVTHFGSFAGKGNDYYGVKSFEIEIKAGATAQKDIEMKACAALLLNDPDNVVGERGWEITDAGGNKVGEFDSLGGSGINSWTRISELPAGDLTLVITKKGYKKFKIKVTTSVGKTSELTVKLEKE